MFDTKQVQTMLTEAGGKIVTTSWIRIVTNKHLKENEDYNLFSGRYIYTKDGAEKLVKIIINNKPGPKRPWKIKKAEGGKNEL